MIYYSLCQEQSAWWTWETAAAVMFDLSCHVVSAVCVMTGVAGSSDTKNHTVNYCRITVSVTLPSNSDLELVRLVVCTPLVAA